jgi:hypothetical protein
MHVACNARRGKVGVSTSDRSRSTRKGSTIKPKTVKSDEILCFGVVSPPSSGICMTSSAHCPAIDSLVYRNDLRYLYNDLQIDRESVWKSVDHEVEPTLLGSHLLCAITSEVL